MGGTEDTKRERRRHQAQELLSHLAQQQRKGQKRKSPTSGWVIADLSRLSGVPVRTVRHYLAKDVLASPEFFGTQTRYDRVHLLRLLAVPLLKAQGIGRLRAMRSKMDELGQSGLSQLVRTHPLPPATLQALGWALGEGAPNSPALPPTPTGTTVTGAQTPQQVQASQASYAQAVHSASSGAAGFEAWQRLTLLPGLELMLRADSPPLVQEIAQRIREQYGAER